MIRNFDKPCKRGPVYSVGQPANIRIRSLRQLVITNMRVFGSNLTVRPPKRKSRSLKAKIWSIEAKFFRIDPTAQTPNRIDTSHLAAHMHPPMPIYNINFFPISNKTFHTIGRQCKIFNLEIYASADWLKKINKVINIACGQQNMCI